MDRATLSIAAGRSLPGTRQIALPLFTAALFLSAFLLFSVEPMFTKMMLPSLGGTPAVWSTAMVFFQTALLAGYGYAHLARLLPDRIGIAVHLAVMALALLALPIGLDASWGRPPATGEAIWLLGVFASSIGLPFFAVAANGPLLQAWFVRSKHAYARNPYHLYAASNIGSFTALAAYPTIVEPGLRLSAQRLAWTGGFALLLVLITACAVLTLDPGAQALAQPWPEPTRAVRRPLWAQRLGWIGLASVPSGLLLAVTAHISTDIAAVPLLWVVPLALYLVTFILAFRERPVLAPERLPLAAIVLTALAFLLTPTLANNFGIALGLHLGLFFVVALSAHMALYATRPGVERLTEFYFYLSLGGTLGGIFCGLAAPHLFSTVLEYPLLTALGLFCRADILDRARQRWPRDLIIVLAAWVALAIAARAATVAAPGLLDWGLVQAGALAAAAVLSRRHPLRMSLFGAAMVATVMLFWTGGPRLLTFRSFFGVHKIFESADGRFRLLSNGTTVHGAMRIVNDDGTPATGRPEPLAYYAPGGSISDAIETVRGARGPLGHVAVIGLGAGTLACLRQPGEAWSFHEIDPVVVRIARDPKLFHFLNDCGADIPIVLGDGRLTLSDSAARNDLIIVDAFSSDAIPIHLLTREAVNLYWSKLAPEGAILFHISNRHLGLARILSRVAAASGLAAYYRHDAPDPIAHEHNLFAPSEVVIATADVGRTGRSLQSRGWSRLEPDAVHPPWSDDYSNIVEAIVDRWRD